MQGVDNWDKVKTLWTEGQGVCVCVCVCESGWVAWSVKVKVSSSLPKEKHVWFVSVYTVVVSILTSQ